MFDIGWDEMAVIAVVALVVIGPKDLPIVLRQAGRWTRKVRMMAAEFQHNIEDMVRETELDQVKSQVEKATDPNLLRREIEKAIDPSGDIARSLEPPVLTDNPMAIDAQDAGSSPAVIPELDASTESAEPPRPLDSLAHSQPPQP